MNDRMTPIPFGELMRWVLTEKNAIFGVRTPYKANAQKTLSLFGETMETPFGPAAGPHTQLAQNIIAAYVAGARFFELKTVQTLDGEDLPVEKPCINAKDECYNVEWSTELRVPEAFEEYAKAWFALKLISKEMGLGGENGFMFNMSVGYDLEGIKSAKIDTFIEGLKNAADTPIWAECTAWAKENVSLFEKVDAAYVDGISPRICTSITLSTLHGCPPQEIERIASYLITEKGLHTFIKCNPTLLGYEFARGRLDAMGYDYLVFDDHHFKHDLQYKDAVPMFTRLQALADARGLSFGVKLTNTFPVKIAAGELPGGEMYMSGRPLFALSTSLAARLSREFGGKLRISYSGGADALNIAELFKTGIYPITLATTLLKPGGYQRLAQMAASLAACEYKPFAGVDIDAIERITAEAATDAHYTKPIKPLPSRKNEKKVPLLDCFSAPCQGGCPIGQDVPEYIRLMGEGKALDALRVITDKNPLPFITGTICNHRCQNKCRRNFYEETVHIRGVKRLAAEGGMDALLAETKAPAKTGAKVAVVGGGAAGLTAAFFLARAGLPVTVFEKTGVLGGVVRHVIPPFRIGADAVERDADLVRAMGAEIKLNHEVQDLAALRAEGYRYIVLAVGASQRGQLRLEKGETINAIDFLSRFRVDSESVKLGRHVVVVGGGNTAMDTARAAKRVPGVETVSIVYRRDMRNMPADEEELVMAEEDGVVFRPLLSPVSLQNSELTCEVMRLGEPDASGRRAPVATGEMITLPADTVIAAVGEKVDTALYEKLGADENTFLAGDGKRGPATVVEAIADARRAADEILRREGLVIAKAERVAKDTGAASKKGWLMQPTQDKNEHYRCLSCDAICECCADVCPNRANIAVQVQGRTQIVHVDRMCNFCGNCEAFCPYDSAPYKDKFTLFHTEKDFLDSPAAGMVVLNKEARQCRVRAGEDVSELVAAILDDYAYLL